MQRRRSYYRSKPRAKRPTDRVIRGDQTTVGASAQAGVYTWTATTPCTITNFKIDTGVTATVSMNGVMIYALVYVPEGYNANPIQWPAVSDDLYNPTKNALITGQLNEETIQDQKSSRYSRKCAVGDRIALIYLNRDTVNREVNWNISFTVIA